MRVIDATNNQLNWLVAKCLGGKLHKDELLGGVTLRGYWVSSLFSDPNARIRVLGLSYCTNWTTGGPIIEKYGILLDGFATNGSDYRSWTASLNRKEAEGPTALIAAMRALAISELGMVVGLPKDLI
jgi:hypothetical protein